MVHNSDNRARAFAEIISVEAWHQTFDDVSQVDLHADVVFSTGRIGGELDSPITFRLNIRRAEIIVIIPTTEPVAVNRTSVSRDNPQIKHNFSHTAEDIDRSSVIGTLGASAVPGRISAKAELSATGKADTIVSNKFEKTITVQMLVMQSKTAEGHYRWMVEGVNGTSLIGRPWDPAMRRLALVDTRRDRTRSVAPTVRLEVRCKREDLLIEDLEVKDEKIWDKVKSAAGFNNRMAAAESYIRDQLVALGLEVGSVDDRFGRLVIASVTAESL